MYDPSNNYQNPNPNAWVWTLLKIVGWIVLVVAVVGTVLGASIFIWVFAKKFGIVILILAALVYFGTRANSKGGNDS